MDPFESRLARTPPAPLDPAWKAGILEAAAAAGARSSLERRPKTSWLTGWTFGWSALAAAWLVIVGLQICREPEPLRPRSEEWAKSIPAELRLQLNFRRQLLSTLLQENPSLDLLTLPRGDSHPMRPRGEGVSPGFGRCFPDPESARV